MNFLIIMSDEHRRDALGSMDHKFVNTPNLDKLAHQGTLFTNAYTPSPMCVPARAAVACGDYVHKIRYWDSATPYNGQKRSWMHSLCEKGVQTVSIGKLHFRSTEDDNGFIKEILPMHVVNKVGWAVGLLRCDPPVYESAKELAQDVGYGDSGYTEYDLAITEAAETWLKNRNNEDKPWAAFISLVSPHYPLTPPEEFYCFYDPEKVDLPIAYDPIQRPKHSELNNIAKFFNYDDYFDEQKMREAIAAYYGLCSFMDNCVGRILNALKQSGQINNTVILYVSDHGEMLGDHGLWTKQVMYEASAGVPMILSGPGVPQTKIVNTATSLLDIYQTAHDVCNVEYQSGIESSLPGESLLKLANQPNDPNRTILSEYHDGGSTTGTFMIRWDKWKYVYYVDHLPQLFDLENDPDEMKDLSGDTNYKTILQEAERRLREICNPEKVNQHCFTDQQKRIEELGGEQACKNAFVFNHTPTPV